MKYLINAVLIAAALVLFGTNATSQQTADFADLHGPPR